MKRAITRPPARLRRDHRHGRARPSAIGGYILSNQRLRFPLIEEKPFEVWVEAQNARGVTPGQGQTVRVAGTRVGDVGEVKLEEGKALIRMDLEPEVRRPGAPGRHRAAAPAHRPEGHVPGARPGHAARAPAVKEGATVSSANTQPDVNADEILAGLDTDTRSYLKLLINGAGKGLEGPLRRPAPGVRAGSARSTATSTS